MPPRPRSCAAFSYVSSSTPSFSCATPRCQRCVHTYPRSRRLANICLSLPLELSGIISLPRTWPPDRVQSLLALACSVSVICNLLPAWSRCSPDPVTCAMSYFAGLLLCGHLSLHRTHVFSSCQWVSQTVAPPPKSGSKSRQTLKTYWTTEGNNCGCRGVHPHMRLSVTVFTIAKRPPRATLQN